jgi:hypothetical protein
MALYKDDSYLAKSDHGAFDALHPPGTVVTLSGIYRCEGCADEYACNKGNPLPPQNKHQHSTNDPIRWRLIVYSQTR